MNKLFIMRIYKYISILQKGTLAQVLQQEFIRKDADRIMGYMQKFIPKNESACKIKSLCIQCEDGRCILLLHLGVSFCIVKKNNRKSQYMTLNERWYNSLFINMGNFFFDLTCKN